MSKTTLILVVAVAILSGIGVRSIWPKTVTETQTVRLPSSTDTVRDTVIDRDTVFRRLIDSIQTTDTLVLADTVWQTDTVRITGLEPRWYVDSASFGQQMQDTSYIAVTWLKADSSGLYRQDALERHIATPGPVQSITADARGVSVDYGEWPEPPNRCTFGCKAQLVLGTASVTSLAMLFFGP